MANPDSRSAGAAAAPSLDTRLRWRPVDIAAAACVAVVLALQLAIPAVQLAGPRQQRFGWQMFSSAPLGPSLTAVTTAGERRPLVLDDYFAFRRGDLHPSYAARLPAHVCRVTPGVSSVEVLAPGADRPAVHPCR